MDYRSSRYHDIPMTDIRRTCGLSFAIASTSACASVSTHSCRCFLLPSDVRTTMTKVAIFSCFAARDHQDFSFSYIPRNSLLDASSKELSDIDDGHVIINPLRNQAIADEMLISRRETFGCSMGLLASRVALSKILIEL